MDTLTRDIIQKHIKYIIAYENNKIIFTFTNGAEKEVFWQNRSRAESWTKEMKENARLKRRKI